MVVHNRANTIQARRRTKDQIQGPISAVAGCLDTSVLGTGKRGENGETGQLLIVPSEPLLGCLSAGIGT
eukprot:811921-Amphidinium_carterae.1